MTELNSTYKERRILRAKRYLGGVSRSAHRLVRSLEESLPSGDVSLESGGIEMTA